MDALPHIEVRDLSMAYGDFVVQRGLDFTVNKGDIFVVMGGNGCGKTTLMRALVGLQRPAAGSVRYGGEDFWNSGEAVQQRLKRRLGILFQGGALWSSLTLAENVALPIAESTGLPQARVDEIVAFKLALVGLAGFEDFYPAELSGGMKKRAGLARAMAREFGPDNIRVNCITPGLIETDITAGKMVDAKKAEINSTIPLARLGRADDVAGACVFLASELSAYCTGITLDVNGGMLIH